MGKQKIPAFGESDFFENQANSTTRVWSIRSACHLLERYRALYLENGYAEKECYARGGADTWIFSDLCTDCEEDMTFTLLNTTFLPVSVQTELYFTEGKAKKGPVVQLKGRSLKPLPLLDKDGTLPATGERLPENTLFAVRFSCDAPIVVSHKTHKAAYHSSY